MKRILFILLSVILSTQLNAAETKSRNASLSIAPTTVMQRLEKKERIFLVDVRDGTNFNKFKIPNAINIPLSFIKTKSFLKTQPVVLINEGYSYTELEREAEGLNESGFDVKIMEGGLWAWKHKGGTIVGDPFAQQDLNKIPSADFFQEKDYSNLVIIDASATKTGHKSELPNTSIHLGNDEGAPDVKALVRALFVDRKSLKKYQKNMALPEGIDLVKSAKTDPLLSAVVINEDGDYSLLEKGIDEVCRDKVFYLEGGVAAYEKFLEFKLLANRPRQDRVKSTEECEECEKENLENKLN
jgi:rhodanese-related sulfurtransferase